jgi:hypothetical protein
MAAMTDTFHDLLRPEHAPHPAQVDAWRWTVRRRLVPVRDRLMEEPLHRRDAWLSARAEGVVRERDALLERLHRLSHQVLVADEVDEVAAALSRLLVDIEHHRQRLHDLAYDDVEIEIGGSE